MKTGVLILNRDAGVRTDGDAGTAADEISRKLAANFNVSVHLVGPGELGAICHDAVSRCVDVVFVCGGDGTISTAAGFLAGTGVHLGVVPFGTLNHFARDIGLPADWRQAIPALANGRTADVDVGEVNGRVFINNCSLGAYPEAVRRRESLRWRRGVRKWPAMVLASIAVFWRLKRMRLLGVVPGRDGVLRTPFVFVANNRYSGHVLGDSLRARLDEGLLWIYTTHALDHLPLLGLAWLALVKRIDLADVLDNWPARELTITPQRPDARIPVALDGELVDLRPPLQMRIRPRALRVIAGRGANA